MTKITSRSLPENNTEDVNTGFNADVEKPQVKGIHVDNNGNAPYACADLSPQTITSTIYQHKEIIRTSGTDTKLHFQSLPAFRWFDEMLKNCYAENPLEFLKIISTTVDAQHANGMCDLQER